MRNWDYQNLENLDLTDKNQAIWYLERLINYGLGEQKLQKEMLEKYLPELKITDNTRLFLELILYGGRNNPNS